MSIRIAVVLLGLTVGTSHAQTPIMGRVTDVDSGDPLPGVHVAVCTPSAGRPAPDVATWSDATGRFVLQDVPPGRWCIEAFYQVQDAGYTLTSPPIDVRAAPLVLHLAVPAALHERLRNAMGPTDPNPKSLTTITGLLGDGYVTDAQGRILQGATTRLDAYLTGTLQGRVVDGPTGLADALLELTGPYRQTRTDAEGRYVFKDIPPGRHDLRVVHAGDTLSVPAVEVQAGVNLFHITFRSEQ